MGKLDEKRKTYYIKKEFQRNFILKFCCLVVLGSLISGAIIYILSRGAVTTTFENSRLTIKSTADYILPAILLSSAVVIVLIGIAVIFITLFTSHKIAGPLYRIERNIKEIIGGNLNVSFNLRAGDEIKPLAASLEEMALVLRNRIVNIKSVIEELELSLKSHESGASIETTREKLNRLKELTKNFNV